MFSPIWYPFPVFMVTVMSPSRGLALLLVGTVNVISPVLGTAVLSVLLSPYPSVYASERFTVAASVRDSVTVNRVSSPSVTVADSVAMDAVSGGGGGGVWVLAVRGGSDQPLVPPRLTALTCTW